MVLRPANLRAVSIHSFIQSEKFGTSLAQALKVYADALRTRRRPRAGS